MRQIYLIARREYLAYVSSPGFWLSLVVMWLILAASFSIPTMVARSQPTRYYAVVAEEPALEAAFQEGLDRARDDFLLGVVRAQAQSQSADSETERRALDAVLTNGDTDARYAAAARELGLPDASALTARSRGQRFPFVRVDAPSTDPEALRPYLQGQAAVETPAGPKPLHAAIFLRRDAQTGVAIDYWSANLTDRTLIDMAQRGMRDLLRSEALAAAGVSAQAVARADALQPRLTELNPEREAGRAQVTLADRLPHFVGMGMAYLLWMVIFFSANFLLTSVIEEKGNKILDSLLASARQQEILVGKLLGVAGVAGTLFLAWMGVIGVALAYAIRAGIAIPPDIASSILDPALLVPFAAYFVLGYLLFGSIYLAIGSLCETIQEAQTLLMPMIFLTMPPLFFLPVALRAPDAPLIEILSWVPFYAPFMMMMRIPTGVPLWEMAGTMAVLAVTALVVLWGASGVFRAGVIGRAGPDALKKLLRGRRAAQPAE